MMLAVVLVPVLGQNHDLVTQTNCSAFPRAFNQLSKRVDQLQVTINTYLTQERACARASVAEGLPSSLIINKTTSFTVLVRDCGGYDLTTGGDNVTATLTCVDYPSLVSPQPTVVDNGDGSYQVSLSPECSGNNLVSVNINGKTIKDMPVTIAVIPPYTSLRLKHTITSSVQGPYAIAFLENGEVYVGGHRDNHVHHFRRNRTKLNSWRAPGREVHSIVIVDNYLYMSQCIPPKVYKYTLTGVLLGPVLVDGCYIHLLIGPDGRLYGSSYTGEIRIIRMTDGSLFHNFTTADPSGIAFDDNGNLHVAKKLESLIKVFTPSGVLVRTYTPPSTQNVGGILIDKAGNKLFASHGGSDPKVIITDKNNNLINKLGMQGFQPDNVAIAPNGDVWIMGGTNDKILIYSQ